MTYQFHWQDRDTAARDMLQLLRYGPYAIRIKALRTLEAIASPVATDALVDVFLDEKRDAVRERYWAGEAIRSLPGDVYLPQLAPLFRAHLPKSPPDVENLASVILLIADCHPSNRDWCFAEFAQATPAVQCSTIISMMHAVWDKTMATALCEILTKHLDADPTLIDLWEIDTLAEQGEFEWLNVRLPLLFEHYFVDADEDDMICDFMWQWPELMAMLHERVPDFAAAVEAQREWWEADETKDHEAALQKLDLWHELEALQKRIEEGDEAALETMIQMTRPGDVFDKSTIPQRALAVHFLGRQVRHPAAFDHLIDLLEWVQRWSPATGVDRWFEYAPLQYEAAVALRDTADPRAWEALVNLLFTGAPIRLEYALVDWISHLTETLSGYSLTYFGHYEPPGERAWFRELVQPQT